MLLLRAGLLELLICFHVIGGAVVFRRLFPRESPWIAFVMPILMVMFVFNFLEHYISMPGLGWLLPFSVCGLLYAMIKPGYTRHDLYLPGGFFVGIFTWALFIMSFNPSITCNTEGVADMARVLDFTFGDKLPPTDSWCPPYDHGGYYSFQHYGASLLLRLFSLDIGTGYNMGYCLLNALTVFVGVGAAFALGGQRIWVALAMLLILEANFTGASVILFCLDVNHSVSGLYYIFDTRLAVDIGDGWNDPNRHNPFGWIWQHRDPPQVLRLFTCTFNTYFPEFHANLGGHFMTLVSLLAANETFKTTRSNWPWICLLVFPIMTVITATWFLVVVAVLCAGCFVAALLARKAPENWKFVLGGAAIAIGLIWPSINSLISGTYPVGFQWVPSSEYTAPWEFVIQWWPIIVPWVALLFIWTRMNYMARWVHIAVPLLLIFVELVKFSDRGLTVEKMWGAVYSASLVTFLPIVFTQRNLFFRFLTFLYLVIGVVFLTTWTIISYHNSWGEDVLKLKGDIIMQIDPQKKRLLQVLQRLHGATVLNGKSAEAYNESPSLTNFSGNRCYIAWFFQEYQCGHGGEAEARDKQSNDFFDGKMTDPLGFLRSNDIAAVMIYPDDKIPDNILQQLQAQLSADYYYINCKGDDPNTPNAGVFMRHPGARTYESTPTPAAPTPTPAPAQ
jgi:hypothetical protein